MDKRRETIFQGRILEILRLIVLTRNFSFEYLDDEFSNNLDARYSVERSLHRMSMIANTLIRDHYSLSKDLKIRRLGSFERFLNDPYSSVNPRILLKTIEELNPIEENLRRYLGDRIPSDFPKVRSKFSVLKIELLKGERFDTDYLEGEVSGFLVALSEFNRVIGKIKDETIDDIEIVSIVRNNPLNVNLKGGIEVVKLFLEIVIPWKRKHLVKMASLTEMEKQTQIEKQRLENERTKVELEEAKFEFKEKKVKLALEVVEKVKPGMGQVDTIKFAMMLLESLEILTESKIQIIEGKGK